jgi:hypothetical protein
MSSIDGQIGPGPSFVSGELSPGVHEIHVEVSDSAGNTSIASIEITVDADLVHTPPADAVEVEALFVALMESTDDRSTTTSSGWGSAAFSCRRPGLGYRSEVARGGGGWRHRLRDRRTLER